MTSTCQPSLGDSCASPGALEASFRDSKQRGQFKPDEPRNRRELETSIVEVMDDGDYEFVPATPPSKKVLSQFRLCHRVKATPGHNFKKSCLQEHLKNL